MALSIADRGYVLETGRLVVEGRPDVLWKNDEVRPAYLGGRTITGINLKPPRNYADH
jgi:branched-chain amino acid transport system ATP-binding protein